MTLKCGVILSVTKPKFSCANPAPPICSRKSSPSPCTSYQMRAPSICASATELISLRLTKDMRSLQPRHRRGLGSDARDVHADTPSGRLTSRARLGSDRRACSRRAQQSARLTSRCSAMSAMRVAVSVKCASAIAAIESVRERDVASDGRRGTPSSSRALLADPPTTQSTYLAGVPNAARISSAKRSRDRLQPGGGCKARPLPITGRYAEPARTGLSTTYRTSSRNKRSSSMSRDPKRP